MAELVAGRGPHRRASAEGPQIFAALGDDLLAPFKLDLGGNDNAKGVTLALSSGLFIGVTIIKKKGLQGRQLGGQRCGRRLRLPARAAVVAGLITMIGGEAANFAAYAYAPAIADAGRAIDDQRDRCSRGACSASGCTVRILGCLMCARLRRPRLVRGGGRVYSMEESGRSRRSRSSSRTAPSSSRSRCSSRSAAGGTARRTCSGTFRSAADGLALGRLVQGARHRAQADVQGHNQLASARRTSSSWPSSCIATQMNLPEQGARHVQHGDGLVDLLRLLHRAHHLGVTIMYKDWRTCRRTRSARSSPRSSCSCSASTCCRRRRTRSRGAPPAAPPSSSAPSRRRRSPSTSTCCPAANPATWRHRGPRRGGGGDESDGSSCRAMSFRAGPSRSH